MTKRNTGNIRDRIDVFDRGAGETDICKSDPGLLAKIDPGLLVNQTIDEYTQARQQT